jgi:hypothetical protein
MLPTPLVPDYHCSGCTVESGEALEDPDMEDEEEEGEEVEGEEAEGEEREVEEEEEEEDEEYQKEYNTEYIEVSGRGHPHERHTEVLQWFCLLCGCAGLRGERLRRGGRRGGHGGPVLPGLRGLRWPGVSCVQGQPVCASQV